VIETPLANLEEYEIDGRARELLPLDACLELQAAVLSAALLPLR